MQIGRKAIILLMLGLDDSHDEGISGITRLQKLIYLLEREEGVKPSAGDDFDYAAYKMGPYSSKLYDDLEMMENLGLIESSPAATRTNEGVWDEAELSFDDLMNENEKKRADTGEERRYRLTEKGKIRVQEIVKDGATKGAVGKIRKTKSKFATYSLKDILYYVYTKYPESTTNSEIKEEVFRRRG